MQVDAARQIEAAIARGSDVRDQLDRRHARLIVDTLLPGEAGNDFDSTDNVLVECLQIR